MTETAKTISFVAAALLAVGAAYFVDYRGAESDDFDKLVGTMINKDIEIGAPKRLEVIKFDNDTAALRKFEVAEVDGVWSLPSKQDYPADATEQMATAVTSLMDRKILRIAGKAPEHVALGVVDPLSSNLDSKSEGVGTRVIMSDGEHDLVDMIIGKAVKDAPGQRYVRNSKQDLVYVVQLDPKSLSTEFKDWIKDDLMELDTFALRRVFINDYSADLSIGMSGGRLVPQIVRDRRSEITLARPKDDAPWEIAAMKKFDPDQKSMIDDVIGADEEIDQDKVKSLVNGLDDLLIVDVAKKPAGLSGELKAGGDFLNNDEARQDLAQKGFIPVAFETGADILSSEGEVVATLNDGVEYVLRFGQLKVQTDSAAGSSDEQDEAAAAEAGKEEEADPATEAGKQEVAAKDKQEKTDAAGENLRRYLFVMARFNESAVERPALKELPPLPEEKAESEEAADAVKPEEAAEAEKPAGDAAAEEAKSGEAPAGEKQDEAKSDDAKADEGADAAKEDEKADDEKKADEEKDAKAVMAERKEIEQENQRLMDEYQSTIAKGQKKVTDLNQRFGDWYFVISNDVFKQIHLGRDQVIKKKEKPKEGDAAADGATSGLPALPGGIPAAPAAGADAAAGGTAAPAEAQQ
jgi:hypothetical protein